MSDEKGHLPRMEFIPSHLITSLNDAVDSDLTGDLSLGDFVDQGKRLTTNVAERGWFPLYRTFSGDTRKLSVGWLGIERGETYSFISPTPYESLLLVINRPLTRPDSSLLPAAAIGFHYSTGLSGVERRDHRIVICMFCSMIWSFAIFS